MSAILRFLRDVWCVLTGKNSFGEPMEDDRCNCGWYSIEQMERDREFLRRHPIPPPPAAQHSEQK